jgi:transposase
MKKDNRRETKKVAKKKTPSAKRFTIGLDLGDRQSHYCVLDHAGEVVSSGSVATTERALQQTWKSYSGSVVALEAGTHSSWVSRALRAVGLEPVIANPRKVRLIAENNQKGDASDAETLARLARADRKLLHEVRPRRLKAQQDLALIRGRAGLVSARTALVNTLRGLAKTLGGRLRKCDADNVNVDLLEDLPEAVREPLRVLAVQIQALTVGIAEYDEKVEATAKDYPETARLQQIKGVGPLIALTYVLTLDDPQRFGSSRDVGAYLGMIPRRRDSSDSRPELRISKEGDTYLRSLLVQGAHYILSQRGPDTDLKRWGLRKAGSGGKVAKRKAVVAVARKLAVLLHHLWVSGEKYEPLRQVRLAEQSQKQQAA